MSVTVLPSLHLTIVSGPHAGATARSTGQALVAGRAISNGLRLPDDVTASAEHARFFVSGSHWYVADCGSRNGVYIDSPEGLTQIQDAAPLADGCRLHMGATQVLVALVHEPAQASATPSPARTALQIRHESGKIGFSLDVDGPLAHLYTTDYPPAVAEGVSRRLDEVMQLANLSEAHALRATEALEALGDQLARQLVPARVLEKLNAIGQGPLLIAHDSEFLPVPWEWVRYEGKAWCEQFDLGRQVVLEHATTRLPEPVARPRPTLLIAVNPTGDLPEAQAEGEALLGLLGRFAAWWEIVFLAGSRVTAARLLAELEQADVVYYLGHGQHDAARPDGSGWLLHDGPLGPEQLRKLRHSPRVILSNACESAREGAQPKAGYGYAEHAGMASRFLLAGVEAYVGALWPIHGAAAAVFGRALLLRFLGGAPLGAAVRGARIETRNDLGDTDLAWASYILYGDPLCEVTSSGQ